MTRPRLLDDTVLEGLAADFGTPLYVYDLDEVARAAATLRRALPEGVGLCYAAKANAFVLGAVAAAVERVEACSPGELRTCRRLGLPAEGIVVSGVHKDEATVRVALSAPGEGPVVTIESAAQLALVERVARELGVRVRLLLRLSSGNQFGLDAGELGAVAARLCRRDAAAWADPVGVQYFSGTQKVSARRLRREVERLDRLVADLRAETGWEVAELEYGPGLPVAYFEGDDLDEPALLGELSDALGQMRFSGRVTLEVGRRLVASCGTYLTRVVDAKVVRGQRYAIVDGGMNHLTYYGQSMAMRRPPCRLVGAGGSAAGAAAGDKPAPGDDPAPGWNVCGSLCTVNDIIAKQLPLEGLGVGSLLAFGRAGAYCATEGMALFLSRDLPAVALVDGAGARLVRGRIPTDQLNAPSHP